MINVFLLEKNLIQDRKQLSNNSVMQVLLIFFKKIEILQLRVKFQTVVVLHSRLGLGSQILVITGRFELQISCIQSHYLTH